MNEKHSPGPWKVNHRGDEVIVAEGPNVGLTLAKVTQFVPEFRAKSDGNARLMAAAPDMLAALDRIFSYVSYVNIHGVGEQPEPREDGQPQPMRVPPDEFKRIFQEIGRLASTSLAKAEGRAEQPS